MQSYAKPPVGQGLDPNDLRNIFAVHWIMRRREGKSDEDAHSLIVFFASCMEIDAFFGGIYADRHILEMLIAWLGRTHAQRLHDFRATTAPFIGKLFLILSHGLPKFIRTSMIVCARGKVKAVR